MYKKENLITLSKLAIVAALYISLSLLITPLSFGAIQLRFSEILILLCLYNKKYSYSLIIGCLITNLFSPFGIIDVIFGTLATAITCYFVSRSKKLIYASLWATFFCLIISAEISLMTDAPFIITSIQILTGEFIVVTLIGCPLFKLITKHSAFMKAINI